MKRNIVIFPGLLVFVIACNQSPDSSSNESLTRDQQLEYLDYTPKGDELVLSRKEYQDKLQGFWLGQCIANWTGLITEMDKIGGEGVDGKGAGFYTTGDWGGPDHPALWEEEAQDRIIDFVLIGKEDVWGADDDTDIEYMYQHLLYTNETSILTGEQIRDGWLKHVYSDDNTPFRQGDSDIPENFLWVSNQAAHDLMREGVIPPETSAPERNPHYEMIDAQLTTEIFGLFAPGRPDMAVKMSYLPIRTTARDNAAWISEFYVIMYSLAGIPGDENQTMKDRLFEMAELASRQLPDTSYSRKMYDYVKEKYDSGISWEAARDSLYQRYQVQMADGYHWPETEKGCKGCFAAGINFGAGLVSLFYGEGDIKETIRIGALCGWDSDNPTATWGGLLGFMMGKKELEAIFEKEMSDQFNIHRTRGNFPIAIDSFDNMAITGIFIIDRVVQEQLSGGVDLKKDLWLIPKDL